MSTRDQKLYTKLFVTNIPGDITKEYFVQLIHPYAKNGKIIEIKFFKRVVSESCYAFIHFESYLDGEKCMEDLNRRILNGHTMRVGPASKRNPLLSTTNLYIEGVPKEWTDADLRKHFGEFGEIAAARILVDKGSNASREVGFVHFTNHENALSAMETWQDEKAYKTAERPFKIKFANKGRKKDDDDDNINNNRSKISTQTTTFDNNNNSIYNNTIGPSQYPQSEMNTPRFDEPCRYFQRGNCKRGKNCFYRHGNVSITQTNTNNYGPHGIPPPPPPPPPPPAHTNTNTHTHTHYDPYTANAIAYSTASQYPILTYPNQPLTQPLTQPLAQPLTHSDAMTAAAAAANAAAYYQHYYANTYPQQYYPPQTTTNTHTHYYSQYTNPNPINNTTTTTATTITPTNNNINNINNITGDEKTNGTSNKTSNVNENNTTQTPTTITPTDTKDVVPPPNVNTITPQSVNPTYGASRQQTTAATNARWDPYKAQTAAVYPVYYPPAPPQ